MATEPSLSSQVFELPAVLTRDNENDVRKIRGAFTQALERLRAQELVLLLQTFFAADPRIQSVRVDGQLRDSLLVTLTANLAEATPVSFEVPGEAYSDDRFPAPVRPHLSQALQKKLRRLRDEVGRLNDGTLPWDVADAWEKNAFGRAWARETLPVLQRMLAGPALYDRWKAEQDGAALGEALPDGPRLRRRQRL